MCKSPLCFGLAALAILSLSSLCNAQKIIVVDANGGGDYKDLPAALAAAKDGDRLVVRKGVYSPGTTSKGLSIVGQIGAVIRTTKALPRFELKRLARGKTFVMQGIAFEVQPWTLLGLIPPPLQILDCDGRVHLEGLSTSLSAISTTYSITIGDSKAVTLTDCALEPGLHTYRSHVVATGCRLFGLDGPPYRNSSGSYGVDAHTATVELVQVVARGGRGSGHAPSFNAVRANRTTLIVRGDAKSHFEGGDHSFLKSPALFGFRNSTLVLDAATLLRARPALTKPARRRAHERERGAWRGSASR